MSVALEEGNIMEARSKCIRLLSILFPLASLMVLLVGYAALGALLFWQIEGTNSRPVEIRKDYKNFLLTLVKTVRNSSENDSSPEQEEYVRKLHGEMQKFNTAWLQSPDQWTFFGAMFFCCTVFTTVGYGNIYPVTVTGKLVCVLYAMVGIPLMLLVITDVGDILAILVSKAYLHMHRLCTLPSLRFLFSCRKAGEKKSEEGDDGVAVAGMQAPMDIRQVLRSQAVVRTKSVKLRNAEIFDRIVARDALARESLRKHKEGLGSLYRSYSCPDLKREPPQRGLWDLCEELEKLDVPLVLILFLFFAYLLFGGLVLPHWETEINIFNAFYFCFITLTTIGFGDIVPQHPKFFMLTSLFIIAGMAILSMAFKLGQSRFVSCYRFCVRGLSGGTVLKYK